MALAPTAAAGAAAPPPTDPATMMGAGADPGAGADDTGADAEPKVLGTILQYPDGSFGLQQGDEAEPDEAAGGGMPGDEAEPPAAAPQKFDDAGKLLNAINDLLESAGGDEGSPRQQAFNDGYGAGGPNGGTGSNGRQAG